MKKFAWVITAVILSVAFAGGAFYCFSEEETGGAEKLIKEAKICIQSGDKEKAVSTLDAAFEAANSAGDYNALMEIGDLYLRADSSLNEKAMSAWTAAGRWKCR